VSGGGRRREPQQAGEQGQRRESGQRGDKRPTAGWRTLAGTGTGATAALAVLVLVAVFVAMALPRASVRLRTHALQQVFATLPSAARTMTATIDVGSFTQSVGGGYLPDQVASARQTVAGQMTAARVPIEPAAAWSSLTVATLPATGAGRRAYYGTSSPLVQIVYRDALHRYARLGAGTWPTAVTRQGRTTIFQAALTPATAARFELHVGSRLSVGPGVDLVVSGIARPVAPGSAFWTEFAGLGAPFLTTTKFSGFWTGGVFVGSGEISSLMNAVDSANAQLAWVYPMNLSAVGADSAAALLQDIQDATGQSESTFAGPGGTGAGLGVASGVSQAITTFVTTEQAVTGILSLLFVSLAVLGIVVLLLCTQLCIDRRRDEFAIMRARGATRWQLGWLALRAGLITTLPAALLAIGLAVLVTPGGGSVLAWRLAIATALAGLIAPALLAARRDPITRRRRHAGRSGRPVGRVRRLVAELTAICVAVAGLIILRQQGLSSSGNVNALASAGPVLAAVPAAIIVVRLCPIVLRWLLRLAGRGRGVVGFVGLARGAQRAASTVLPVFVLVLALALVTFGGTVRVAIDNGQTAAAWALTGADAMVGSPGSTVSLTAPARQEMASVRGVRLVAPVVELRGVNGPLVATGTPINVAFVDPRQYAAVLAQTPAPPFPAAALARTAGRGLVPVIASPSAAALLRSSGDIANINEDIVHVVVKAELTSTPAAVAGAPFIVAPLWAEGSNLPPVMMLLSGPRIDDKALAAVVARTAPNVNVTFRSAVQKSLAAAPLPRASYLAYAQGSAAAALFCVLAVLISLMLGARARELVDARLSTMGLTAWQARKVGIVEAVPFILAAAVGGVVTAVALVPLIGPVLDLSVFTGAPGSVHIQPDVAILVIGSAALVLLALATLAAQAAAAHHRGIGRSLRVGE
jgi:putative ABC transport system permease protein